MQVGGVSGALSAQFNTGYVPFPGKRANFRLKSGDWKVDLSSIDDLVRRLEFASETDQSFIEEVAICGYRKGEVKLQVVVNQSYEKIAASYFTQIGFGEWFEGYGCTVDKSQGMENLFSIIAWNNTFPKTHRQLLEKLVKAGEWESVTPLAPDEKLPQQIDSRALGFYMYGSGVHG